MLLITKGNISSDTRFRTCAIRGNEHQWTIMSLFAEVGAPAKVPVEQEEKLYFCQIWVCGMFYALYISVCDGDI